METPQLDFVPSVNLDAVRRSYPLCQIERVHEYWMPGIGYVTDLPDDTPEAQLQHAIAAGARDTICFQLRSKYSQTIHTDFQVNELKVPA